ncbi:hypothetical protein [Roseovarius arcticus]|uniref:hypothetical protein n=1 Tax=Roseovarius arcticus TaxID=2547404 RepID=UPI00110FFC52|nr:hypothetical protein [Roseovarius arcticus]
MTECVIIDRVLLRKPGFRHFSDNLGIEQLVATKGTPEPRERTVKMASQYEANSITISGAIATGTGVMIGSGIFALTG